MGGSHRREVLSALFLHFKNSGEDDMLMCLRGIIKKKSSNGNKCLFS